MASKASQEETFAERLRRLRLERGFSQHALAHPGVSYAYISRLEAGTRNPSVRAIRTLARHLTVSPEYLETGLELSTREALELQIDDLELAMRLSADDPDLERLRVLAADVEALGEPALHSRALTLLGSALFATGAYAEAITCLEQAIAADGVSTVANPAPFLKLARAYAASGRTTEAVSFLRRCQAELEAAGEKGSITYVRFAASLTYALSDTGELDQANKVLADALADADDVEDPKTRVQLLWSQARVSLMSGEPRRALAGMRQAISLLEPMEETRELARAHILHAEMLIESGEVAGAGEQLTLAEQLLQNRHDAEDLQWLRVLQAKQAARAGSPELAISLGEEALGLIGDYQPVIKAMTLAALAEAYVGLGDTARAGELYGEALALHEEQRGWHDAAQVANAYAQILRQEGKANEAADMFARAADLALRRAG